MKTLAQIEPRTPISALPFAITQRGSYYLTTNLTGVASGGITISASGVTLDLMGFELVGGTGSGILVSGSRNNITVRNGTVRNWSDHGVGASSAANSQFDQLRARDNVVFGINVGAGSSVSDCQAVANNSGIVTASGASVSRCVVASNFNPGIDAGAGSMISGCTVYSNFGGILAGEGSTVIGCTVRQNNSSGIDAGGGSVVKDCAVSGHTGNGISAGTGSTVNGCTAYLNQIGINVSNGSTVMACTASLNTSNGISVAANCVVNGCTAVSNTNYGIEGTGGYDRIEGNHTHANGLDLQTGSSPGHNMIIRNNFNGAGFALSDFVGAIESGSATMNSNKNPHANFLP
jgi:hypothetical protein